MYNPRSNQPLPAGPLRLPTLSRLPDETDVSRMFQEAQASRGRQIKMGWATSQDAEMFLLSLVWADSQPEPTWTMHKGDEPLTTVLWTYSCGDIYLILNFVLSECMGGMQAVDTTSNHASNKLGLEVGLSQSLGAEKSVVPAPPAGTRERALATMQGDLSEFSLPSLLQSVDIAGMTGMLGITSHEGSAEIYFVEGRLVHAESLGVSGEQALLDLFTWEEGKFQFYKDERTSENSIKKRMDQMIMEGVTLFDQAAYLRSQGVKAESYLIKKLPDLSKQALTERLSKGAPLDEELQKQFYDAVDDRTTVFNLALRHQLNRVSWVPVLFNMVSCGILAASDRPIAGKRQVTVDAVPFDSSSIDFVRKALEREETAVYTHGTFLFFLEQEFLRYETLKQQFSIITLAPALLIDGTSFPLPVEAIRQISACAREMKRPLDIFAHYETLGFALLLPSADSNYALLLAQGLYQSLHTLSFVKAASQEGAEFALSVGIASVPEHAISIGELIAAARAAISQTTTTSPIAVAGRL